MASGTPNSKIVRTLRALLAGALAGLAWGAAAAEVRLIGVFPGKAAILAIDGGEPRTVRIGQQLSGIKVLAVERERADVEIAGKRQTLALGQYQAAAGASSGRQIVTIAADARGHFVADGAINGSGMRFVVDTGATMIAISVAEANRLGLDYRKGRRGFVQTANGTATAYAMKFDTVKVGGIELNGVDGMVVESGLGIALLGMSFLNRVEMRREGETMTLTKRF
jgi:aspartyl protease family protein